MSELTHINENVCLRPIIRQNTEVAHDLGGHTKHMHFCWLMQYFNVV